MKQIKNLALVLGLAFAGTAAIIPDSASIRMARGEAATVSGTATIWIQVPADGRKIAGGWGYFARHDAGEYLCIHVYDSTKTVIIGTYTDDDLPAGNRGWYFAPDGTINLERIAEHTLGHLPGNAWLKIEGVKPGGAAADMLYANITWGE